MLIFKRIFEISKKLPSLSFLIFLQFLSASCWSETVTFSSVSEAVKKGINAYQGGYYEIAIPALEYAANKKNFMAEYYLARIYSENSAPHTDHPRAYNLFQSIADEYADGDPDDDPHAPYVGKSLTALAIPSF